MNGWWGDEKSADTGLFSFPNASHGAPFPICSRIAPPELPSSGNVTVCPGFVSVPVSASANLRDTTRIDNSMC